MQGHLTLLCVEAGFEPIGVDHCAHGSNAEMCKLLRYCANSTEGKEWV